MCNPDVGASTNENEASAVTGHQAQDSTREKGARLSTINIELHDDKTSWAKSEPSKEILVIHCSNSWSFLEWAPCHLTMEWNMKVQVKTADGRAMKPNTQSKISRKFDELLMRKVMYQL